MTGGLRLGPGVSKWDRGERGGGAGLCQKRYSPTYKKYVKKCWAKRLQPRRAGACSRFSSVDKNRRFGRFCRFLSTNLPTRRELPFTFEAGAFYPTWESRSSLLRPVREADEPRFRERPGAPDPSTPPRSSPPPCPNFPLPLPESSHLCNTLATALPSCDVGSSSLSTIVFRSIGLNDLPSPSIRRTIVTSSSWIHTSEAVIA